MNNLDKIKAEIERRWKELADKNVKAGGNVYDCEISQLLSILSFIESLEKEPKGKTNPLFEECLANVDPIVRKEVSNNIDKILEKEKSEIPTIKGWVARDSDNALFFHLKKPQKFHEDRIAYWANGGYRFIIPQSIQVAFLKICTTDEPIEVELTISRVIK